MTTEVGKGLSPSRQPLCHTWQIPNSGPLRHSSEGWNPSGLHNPFPHSGNDHPSSILTRAKQGRADAHDGRALGDGRLHILTGAHGQCVQLRRLPLQPRQTCPERRKGPALRLQPGTRGWQRHQPPHGEPLERPERGYKIADLGERNARLAGLPVHIDLDANVKRRQGRRAGVMQPPGHLEPRHAMRPVKTGGNRAGLVGLHRPDEVPAQLRVTDRGQLGLGLLPVVFTERQLPGIQGRPQDFGRPGLADGQQADRTGPAPVFLLKRPDLGANSRKIISNRHPTPPSEFSKIPVQSS